MPVIPPIGGGCNRVVEDPANAELQQMGNTNPWKEIEQTVRRVDEEKVKDCTEDIDALLVFAGLYSAVLTAFLIESYKSLQADPTQDYLRQIALQTSSYNFNNGYLNATFAASQFPPFQASKSDIRVNVCWFASLMLSLSSASFGILVKQWLREFLSISYISPQERIRIRDIRVQGLGSWKLFEIASFLPVLLQISLALFFVGLCFFTAGVHSSIGTTSLFLVICWAFFFIMSIVAPLVSSRCPYKTTSLKSVFQYARPHVRSLIRISWRRLATGWFADTISTIIRSIYRVAVWPYKMALELLLNPHPTREDEETALGGIPPANTATDDIELGDYISPSILQELLQYNVGNAISIEPLHGEQGHDLGMSLEENELRSVSDNDLVVFGAIDSSFFDDTLLTAMQKALQRPPHPLRQTLLFSMTVFQSRLGFRPLEGSAITAPWPCTLSRTARMALMGILADGMDHTLLHGPRLNWKELTEKVSEWSISFAFIVSLSSPCDPIPCSVVHLFQKISKNHTEHDAEYSPLEIFSYQMRALSRCDSRWPIRSLLFLARCLNTLGPEDAANCVQYIAHKTFVNTTDTRLRGTYRFLLREHDLDAVDGDAIAPTPETIVILLEMARIILHQYTVEQIQSQDEFPYPISQLLAFVFNAIPAVQKSLPKIDFDKPLIPAPDSPSVGLYQVLTDLFTTRHTTHSLLDYFTTHPEHLLIPTDTLYCDDQSFSFPDLVNSVKCSRDEDIAILTACATFFEQNTVRLQRIAPNALLRMCYLVYMFSTGTDDQIRACWHRMFASVTSCLRTRSRLGQTRQRTSCEDEHKDQCNTAFALLNEIHSPGDDGHDEPGEDIKLDCIVRSQVPNEIIDVLRHNVCDRHAVDPETDKIFWRIKHLEDLDRIKSRKETTLTRQPMRGEPDDSVKIIENVIRIRRGLDDTASAGLDPSPSTTSISASEPARLAPEGVGFWPQI